MVEVLSRHYEYGTLKLVEVILRKRIEGERK
jgi:hypothetical protein